MARKVKDDLAEKARAYFRAREMGKKYYAKADAIAKAISVEIEPGQPIDLGKKGTTYLVNNFSKARANPKYVNPTIFVMAGGREWELEEPR